jgi:hypothetical protein
VQAINSKHTTMAEMIVPVSMALLTDYDDTYLGAESQKGEASDADEPTG